MLSIQFTETFNFHGCPSHLNLSRQTGISRETKNIIGSEQADNQPIK